MNVRKFKPFLLTALFSVTTVAVQAKEISEDGTMPADIIAWIVLFIVPAVFIWLFIKVHILPEKIAEQRNHSQKDAIAALCVLSLFIGGLLWPFALVWAYSSPVRLKVTQDGKEVARVESMRAVENKEEENKEKA